MKTLVPVVAAGGTFAGAAIVGLIAGALAAAKTAEELWVPAGLAIGGAIGAYGAVRLLARSFR